MASAGIRELRQRASELLRRVEAGETIEITDRGRLVALLGPAVAAGPLDGLRSAGEVVAAKGSIDELPDPLPLPDGREFPSATLARLRRDDR
ncbi:MAG: type II toxin-antitoxin system Phd/YefM family antitoxin [Candidatus Dormibacteria bacterium]